MQPMNQQATLDERYRTMVILWFALTASIGIFFLFTVLSSPADEASENPILSLTFLIVGVLAVIASYFVKQKFLARSVNEQDVRLVHTGLVVAGALSEVAGMLGLMDYLLTGQRYYYLLMIVAFIGSLLNFPRRDHVLAASYKSSHPKDPWK